MKNIKYRVAASILFFSCMWGTTSFAEEAPPLIPVRNFVADWHGSGGYQISPNARQLMWVARLGLGPGLFVKDLQTGVVTSYKIPGSGMWARDSRHILLHLEKNGDENTHVLMLDTAKTELLLRDLTPFAGARSYVHKQLPHSDDLIIASNKRDAKVYDLYRYVHTTGALQLIAINPGQVGKWLVDDTGEVIGRARLDADTWIFETTDMASADHWTPTFRVSYFDKVVPIAPSAKPNHWWALSNRARDKLALVEIDLHDGKERVEYADATVDLSSAYWSASQQKILAVVLDPDAQRWDIFAPQLKEAIHRLRGESDARITINNFSDDERWMTATVTRHDSGEHVLYDLQNQNWTVMGQLSRSRMNNLSPLPIHEPVHFKSRDGLDLHGYLSLPLSTSKPFPAVVYVHGGPWARDMHLDTEPMVPFLVNRGYAVLQVNYRGSSGYGKAFQEAARGEFAGKMHNDLIDAVDTLISKGVIDPKRIAIAGASFGGYASLVGMAFTPGKFSCGISAVGMSDLTALIENAPPYWALGKPHWMRYVGDPNDPMQRADMQERSPLHKVNQVQGPVLLIHGLHDPRVNVSQSIKMANALRSQGKEVDLHIFNNAGHGFQRWQDNLRYYRLTEDFLAECLGGRSGGFDFFEIGTWLF